MKPTNHKKSESERRLHERIGLLMVRGQYRSALELLDKVIEDPMPLFQGEDWVMEERRLAWIYRIHLLRERDQMTQALAWACLEVELNPDNVAAVALKERLKREAGILPRRGATPTAQLDETTSRNDFWKGVAGMRDLKAMLERDVILPLLEPEIYARYKITLPNGILLYGPPGCGKTFIARKLAVLLEFNFMEVTTSVRL
jgi:Cdc6-like AAA superfamily ATPase